MSNLFDYVEWRGDLSFTASPLNEVDIVILSQIVLLDLTEAVPNGETVTLKECDKTFGTHGRKKKLGAIIPEQIKDLLHAMGGTKRFSEIKLSNYVEDIDESTEIQFSALTADAEDINARFVVFSGTDDTLVGWKENFNLIFKTPTGAQLESVKYLEAVTKNFTGDVYVLGHSKGGHLALYSTAYCSDETLSKIVMGYSLDGPGLPEGGESVERLERVKDKIVSILPQGSVIGRLFEHKEHIRIIHSNAEGLFQHDAFSWEVKRNKFQRNKDFTDSGSGVDHGMRAILSEMSEEERKIFVEGIFGMFAEASCKTLTDVTSKSREVLLAYFKTQGQTKRVLNRTLAKLFSDKYTRGLIFFTGKNLRKYMPKKEIKETADTSAKNKKQAKK